MEREQLGVAIVGAGTFGAKHAEALTCMPTARLVAVGDRDAMRAQRMARCYGAHAANSIGDILQRNDVDGVILTTPTNTHLALTLEAVEAGKHVLVEKPAALTLEDFDAMQEAASAASPRATPALHFRLPAREGTSGSTSRWQLASRTPKSLSTRSSRLASS